MKPDDSIREELNLIAPFLASLQKSHPFTVPENYFDALEMKLISVERTENVNDEAALFGLNEHPFNVPENYFRDFPSSVLLRIKNEKRKISEIKPTIPFRNQMHNSKFWLAAASVAFILIVSLFLFKRYQPEEIASIENQYGLRGAAIENTQSDLLYAADIDEGVVVDLYIQDQNQQQDQENSFSQQNMSNENNYLRDAADIDPYLINEM